MILAGDKSGIRVRREVHGDIRQDSNKWNTCSEPVLNLSPVPLETREGWEIPME